MSKERELLESTIEYLYDLQSAWLWKKDEVAGNGEEYNDLNNLIVKIREHLSQPEQEPVAWMYKRIPLSTGVLTRGATDYIHMGKDKPLFDDDFKATDLTPLYLAPPTREPIKNKELEIMYSKHAWAMEKEEYMWGFRDAEKHYGIEQNIK